MGARSERLGLKAQFMGQRSSCVFVREEIPNVHTQPCGRIVISAVDGEILGVLVEFKSFLGTGPMIFLYVALIAAVCAGVGH